MGFRPCTEIRWVGLLFVLLILGIGLLIVLYAAYYLPETDRLGRFYALLLSFAGGMLGVVLAENLLLLLVFWEITSRPASARWHRSRRLQLPAARCRPGRCTPGRLAPRYHGRA